MPGGAGGKATWEKKCVAMKKAVVVVVIVMAEEIVMDLFVLLKSYTFSNCSDVNKTLIRTAVMSMLV